MKKYIYITFILIITLVIALYLNISNVPYNPFIEDKNIKTYSANGISFNYTKNFELTNKTGKYVITYLKDTTVNETDGKPGAVVEISRKAAEGIPVEKFYEEIKTGASGVPGYQESSERKIQVDNKAAYEFVASGMDNGVEEQFRIILFEKGGYIYMISCGTRSPTYLADKNRDFDVIINSFKVTD